MREYKFRGKAIIPIEELDKLGIKHDNGWVYGNLITGNEAWIVGSIIECDDEYIAHEWWCKVDRNTIGQYTGLKDKNGTEVYEGDTVRWNNKIGYIGFLKQEMGYCIILKDTDFRLGHRNIGSGYDFNADIEVIGNIYENPELI